MYTMLNVLIIGMLNFNYLIRSDAWKELIFNQMGSCTQYHFLLLQCLSHMLPTSCSHRVLRSRESDEG